MSKHEGWSNIVLEGFCMFKYTKRRRDPAPKYCQGISPRCVVNGKNEICRFLGYTVAEATIVVTDNEGRAVIGDNFDNDELDQRNDLKEWRKQEKEWVTKWADRIKEES